MESELVFQEKDHKYFLNGEEIPSVSELTRFLSREIYGEADPIALERAAEKGTAVHKALQTLDETGEVEVYSDYEGYIQAYMNFHKDHKIEWKGIELQLENGEYAGTLDRIGIVDGVDCILDFKTTSRITKSHELLYSVAQTLYFKLARRNYLIVDKLYILQLKSDGTYKLIDLPFNLDLAEACLTFHRAIAKTKKKRTSKKQK